MTGQTLLLNMVFTNPELVDEVTSLSLVNLNGTAVEWYAVKRGQGIYSGAFHAIFTPSIQNFRFQLTGKTAKGKLFRRVKPTQFKLETVELGFRYRLDNNSNRIFPGITTKIPLKIRNTGRSQAFTLKTRDDLGFVKSLVPSYYFVAENETAEFSLEVRAPNDASPGETTTVAVYATQASSEQLSNYMVFYVSVAAKVRESHAQDIQTCYRKPKASYQSLKLRYLKFAHKCPASFPGSSHGILSNQEP